MVVDGTVDVTWDFLANQPAGLTLADVAGLTVNGGSPVAIISQVPQEIVLRYAGAAAFGDPWLTTAASAWCDPGQAGVLVEI